MEPKTQPAKQTAPPYTSFKTFKTFLAGLRITMPSRIDRSVMHNFSGAVKTQLIHALRALSLIDESGVPDEDLPRLVNSEGPEREKVLRRVLQKGYPFLFNAQIDLGNATAQQLIEKFSKAGATGDTARKSIAFFLEAAKDAGLSTSPYFKKAGSQARGPRKVANGAAGIKPASPKNEEPKRETVSDKPSAPPSNPETMGWTQLLLSKFPSFDPTWPDDVKSKWFDAFDKLMKAKEG